jgi:hypothetical protein
MNIKKIFFIFIFVFLFKIFSYFIDVEAYQAPEGLTYGGNAIWYDPRFAGVSCTHDSTTNQTCDGGGGGGGSSDGSWQHSNVASGAFCYDGDEIYPMDGVKIKLRVVSAYSNETQTLYTDTEGVTSEMEITRHLNGGVDPWSAATLLSFDPANTLSNGTPYSQLKLRTDGVYTYLNVTGDENIVFISNYVDADCSKITYSKTTAYVRCSRRTASPSFVFENCGSAPGSLSLVAKKALNSGVTCDYLSTADSLSGLGMAVDVTDSLGVSTGSYILDGIINY